MNNSQSIKTPSALVALIPLAVLILLLALTIHLFGGDAIAGGSQLSLLTASAVCTMLVMGIYRTKWQTLEDAIIANMRSATPAIIILLLIGAIAGTWMASGIIPTLIYYGLKILHPSIFLPALCIICAVISLLTGSSWTTIATIGVALMGVGRALGFEDGWIAGAIISGAYFGDKISLMSDTTVLASSTVEVPLFTHIKYMLITTTPSLLIALVVFAVVGFSGATATVADTLTIEASLQQAFNISPWLLIVPLVTGLLIAKNPNASCGHIVWAIILFVFSVLSLVSPIVGMFQQGIVYQPIKELFGVLLEVLIYFDYIKTDFANSTDFIREYWRNRGVSFRTAKILDGCGLAPQDAISPSMYIQLLRYMYGSKHKDVFLETLPCSGESGTLSSFLRGTPLHGKVCAKSGTIGGTKNYAGYIFLPDGRVWVFAVMVNSANCKSKKLQRIIEQYLLNVYQANT